MQANTIDKYSGLIGSKVNPLPIQSPVDKYYVVVLHLAPIVRAFSNLQKRRSHRPPPWLGALPFQRDSQRLLLDYIQEHRRPLDLRLNVNGETDLAAPRNSHSTVLSVETYSPLPPAICAGLICSTKLFEQAFAISHKRTYVHIWIL